MYGLINEWLTCQELIHTQINIIDVTNTIGMIGTVKNLLNRLKRYIRYNVCTYVID